MCSSDDVECPICFSWFSKEKIDLHVNACLNLGITLIDKGKADNDVNDGPHRAKKTKQDLYTCSTTKSGGETEGCQVTDKDRSATPHRTSRSLSEVLGKKTLVSRNTTGSANSRNEKFVTTSKGTLNFQESCSREQIVDENLERESKRLKLDSASSPKSEDDRNTVVVLPSRNGVSSNQRQSTTSVKTSLSDERIVDKYAKTSSKQRNKDVFTTGVPLAEQMRPVSIEEYIGQEQSVGKQKVFRSLIEKNEVPSMIFWGPPGCGKTSLAHIIANNCKKTKTSRFAKLSATTSGVSDVKEAVKVAKNERNMFKRKTILFIDEIHRFNKLQQQMILLDRPEAMIKDTFLPHVEDGTITLIGATTENPSFHVNNALLSRCQVIVLDKLSNEDILEILDKAAKKLETTNLQVTNDALVTLANLSDGDARAALNGLEMAVNSQIVSGEETFKNGSISGVTEHTGKHSTESVMNGVQNKILVTPDHVNEVLQRKRVAYDRNGEEHYNMISALHKSIRGSDANAALYWLARMLEGGEQPLYIARRLVRLASEDIGLADPCALQQAVAAYQACHFIGMPECDVILAQAAVYLSRAPKSVEVYAAYDRAKSLIRNCHGPLPGVPLHLRNAPTKLMKDIGYGKGYKYNPGYKEPVEQDYLPKELLHTNFFAPD